MPETNPDELAFIQSILTPAGECPDAAALSGADANPEIQRHLAACARCRTELAMLREFESGEPVVEELASVKWIESELVRRASQTSNAAPARRSASIWERLSLWAEEMAPRRRLALSMAGVSLLLIAGAGIYFQRAGEPPLTNPVAPAVWRSLRFAAIEPVGDLTQPPAVFRWEAVPGAAKYEIHLRGVDGIEVWSAESAETTIAPPQAIRSMLTGGRAFRWMVDARNTAGEKIASTDSQTFHILATTR